MFNRKYIFKSGSIFQPAMLVYRIVEFFLSLNHVIWKGRIDKSPATYTQTLQSWDT